MTLPNRFRIGHWPLEFVRVGTICALRLFGYEVYLRVGSKKKIDLFGRKKWIWGYSEAAHKYHGKFARAA